MQAQKQFDELVPEPQVRKELGGISEMTTWRWDHNLEKAPPGWEPPIRIGNRKFRRRSGVETVKSKLLQLALNNQRRS
jgi:hypothetical protein